MFSYDLYKCKTKQRKLNILSLYCFIKYTHFDVHVPACLVFKVILLAFRTFLKSGQLILLQARCVLISRTFYYYFALIYFLTLLYNYTIFTINHLNIKAYICNYL